MRDNKSTSSCGKYVLQPVWIHAGNGHKQLRLPVNCSFLPQQLLHPAESWTNARLHGTHSFQESFTLQDITERLWHIAKRFLLLSHQKTTSDLERDIPGLGLANMLGGGLENIVSYSYSLACTTPYLSSIWSISSYFSITLLPSAESRQLVAQQKSSALLCPWKRVFSSVRLQSVSTPSPRSPFSL